MFDLFQKYVAERYARFEDGQIWFGKEQIAVNFVPILVREFYLNMALTSPKYHATMFIEARKNGYDYVRQHGLPLMKSFTPMIRLGFELINLFGVGAFRPVRADEKEGFMVVVGRSTIGYEMKYEKLPPMPIDSVVGGLVSGAIQYYTKKPMYAVETACTSQPGVQECVIVSGGRNSILNYIEKFSPDKMAYAKETLDQIEDVEKEVLKVGNLRWNI